MESSLNQGQCEAATIDGSGIWKYLEAVADELRSNY
jgi:hypothetical protein